MNGWLLNALVDMSDVLLQGKFGLSVSLRLTMGVFVEHGRCSCASLVAAGSVVGFVFRCGLAGVSLLRLGNPVSSRAVEAI